MIFWQFTAILAFVFLQLCRGVSLLIGLSNKGGFLLDSIDYYNRYAVPYYEETVNVSMEDVM